MVRKKQIKVKMQYDLPKCDLTLVEGHFAARLRIHLASGRQEHSSCRKLKWRHPKGERDNVRKLISGWRKNHLLLD